MPQVVVTRDQIILAADVTTEANDSHQRTGMLGLAQAAVETVIGEDAVLDAPVADAGHWSEANAASETEECTLFSPPRRIASSAPPCVRHRRHVDCCPRR